MDILGRYRSATQRARVFSEAWVEEHFRCPSCSERLQATPNNTQALDFTCPSCCSGFELKSKKGAFGRTVADGAYAAMLARIRASRSTSLILLGYTEDYRTRSVIAVPARFLVEALIVPRKPLGPHCRRAGWQGCNINIGLLPPDGRIVCVHEFVTRPQAEICQEWKRTAFLEDSNSAARSWLAVIMGIVSRLERTRFSLADVYQAEGELAERFPGNSNLRAKIRQQLQVLRDKGWLTFLGNGQYAVSRQSAPYH
ncbi:MAG: hypothetical protein KA603_02175 [Azonexus sp.]|jgi:type II restriction enzyme|nr:restriction endonuclease [Betaproteobacteria bacterium]MBK8919686.1 restriction endonuclease [Betaproteobacteria bacterium]MBP6034928.1 hypothetical protein [Azonexus sp.]MBP6905634.1 hypothetical protein [Azonexus sp.]